MVNKLWNRTRREDSAEESGEWECLGEEEEEEREESDEEEEVDSPPRSERRSK